MFRIGPDAPACETQLLYKKYDTLYNRPAAGFKLIQDDEVADRYNIPLKVVASFVPNPKGGTYLMIAEGDGPRLVSHTFTFEGYGIEVRMPWLATIGPFFLDDVRAECPFRISVSAWIIYEVDNPVPVVVQQAPICPEIFFFLGSPALNLEEVGSRDAHIHELLTMTIPKYNHIKGKSWDRLEPHVVKSVMGMNWKLGKVDFNWASSRSCPFQPDASRSYLLSIGRMLGNVHKKSKSSVTVFDLAALMYAAFKAFGRRRMEPNGPEVDVSPPLMNLQTALTK